MRILHAVYSLEMGGAEVIVAQLARLHRSQGHDVRIACYSKLGVLGEALRTEGFELYVLGEAHPLLTMARYYKLIATLDPDVVHCHNVAPTIQAALPARLASVRCVLTTRHGFTLDPYPRNEELKYNAAGHACDHIVGVCQAVCDGIEMGALAAKDRIRKVYNGALPLAPVKSDEVQKRGFTLLFVGRLEPVKNLTTLLEGVAQAREHVPGLACWIVGDGSARAGLEARAAELGLGDVVRFWGMRMDTAAFFSAADVFVMSSVTEGLPMSLLQAMSLGVPSILTDVGGMGEVSRLTQSGLLVPVGDGEAYGRAIVRMATDEALRSQLSTRAQDEYERRFTLERMGEHYLELYANRV
ncbi:Glycosyltransferase involved in cell wall bisynthesis [Bryocella elongata]|uniref:Glycosyltransferase involved in cell wall bisynthesis n=1 Tax=Bryocella elongata TaxID=863522 RepID=A0A1H5XZX2_9BACT|nr:glycosyltransferase [Bryocella elongata]SEG17095.1 Glycosyltransferase involved in cell wall bisynthesis [Bryocella elongata]